MIGLCLALWLTLESFAECAGDLSCQNRKGREMFHFGAEQTDMDGKCGT